MAQVDRMRALLDVLIDRTRRMIAGGRERKVLPRPGGAGPERLLDLARALLGERSQSSGVSLAKDILKLYAALNDTGKTAFFDGLARGFGPDPAAIESAWAAYQAAPGPRALAAVTEAAEPPRQELLRRLNQAPGATADLVRLRADLLRLLPDHPDLTPLEQDLTHLLRSWFNRGFLVLRRIDWSSPADLLERIIRYEAVHSITTWAALRDRLQPQDRRCYAFVHPAMPEEPLIFVEVALTTAIPNSIQALLAGQRTELVAGAARVAAFYSISNCQPGLAGVSFGQFLIKQVVEELSAEFPRLETFVTLSPAPGFRRWLEAQAAAGDALAQLALADDAPMDLPETDPRAARRLALAARYFLTARDGRGRPVDPVARFHLGNGARVERLCWMADTSPKGLSQADGLMVNYLYDPATLEANHDAFTREGEIIAGPAIRRALRDGSTSAPRAATA